MLARLRAWARGLKRDGVALWLAARDPRTPWAARLIALAVAAYALSPIDLIPDFIPVLGLLDDLIIVPMGLWLALRLMPDGLMDDYRARAAMLLAQPQSRVAAAIIILVWIALAALTLRWIGGRLP
jgi:uncharacterized membrane protein YkvA (DUF1232 family)